MLPKKRRRSEIAAPENGSLMPSAGTIFSLKIEFGSYHRNHRRRHSPHAHEGGTREH
jgi:hypothetical protein